MFSNVTNSSSSLLNSVLLELGDLDLSGRIYVINQHRLTNGVSSAASRGILRASDGASHVDVAIKRALAKLVGERAPENSKFEKVNIST